MLATLEGLIRIQLHPLVNIRGTNHAQIVHLHINPHTRIILGRTYHQLFLTPGTQELAPHITLPSCYHIKGHHRTKKRQSPLGSHPPTQRGHARNIRGCYPTSRGRRLQYRSRRCHRKPGTEILPTYNRPTRRCAGHKRSRRPRSKQSTTPPPHQDP